MPLTAQQRTTLAADIRGSADPAVVAALAIRNDTELARLYNELASPAFWAWRTSVPKAEITSRASRTGSTFTWAGNGFITRSVGELECWNQLFGADGTCNAALPNVRQAFADIFSGAGNAAANRTHLDAVARRQATRAERLFAAGSGADSAAGAGTFGWEGTVTIDDIGRALNDNP